MTVTQTPGAERNRVGLTRADYDGAKTTLCPGCGHTMELVRVIPKGSYRTEQEVFQCRRCRVALTQAGERAPRAG